MRVPKGMSVAVPLAEGFVNDAREIILSAREKALRSVDFERVQMYWRLGKRIFEEEQGGQDRAEYRTYLITTLAGTIEPEFGSGFGKRPLQRARQFYRTYPIASALRTQFNWFQYRQLIAISDESKREYYELETLNNAWNGRELEPQINSQLYERLLLSNDKEAVLAVARRQRIPQSPQEIIKDPTYLEFLGLSRESAYYENDLESAIITHLQAFLLELGNGFSFVARQKRIHLEDDEFFVDLVCYNRLLRCFVLFEIKTQKLTHEDLGQLQMYVNYFDRCERTADEAPTVGILLCAAKNDAVVRMTLPEGNATILASQYQLYLPSETVLLQEVESEIERFDEDAKGREGA